jgi:CheY-like chemotaxis protein
MQVLVADHDPWTRQVLTDLLNSIGCSVRQTSNGMSALRLAAEMQPDVAVLGPALPEVATADLQRELGADLRTRGIGVIVLRSHELSDLGNRTGLLRWLAKALRPARKSTALQPSRACRRARGARRAVARSYRQRSAAAAAAVR